MSNPLGKKVVAPTPQSVDPATVFTHVRGEIWMDGTGKLRTSEHGAKHPPDWKPPLPPLVFKDEDDEGDLYGGFGYAAVNHGCGV